MVDVSTKCASINFLEDAVRHAMVAKKPRDCSAHDWHHVFNEKLNLASCCATRECRIMQDFDFSWSKMLISFPCRTSEMQCSDFFIKSLPAPWRRGRCNRRGNDPNAAFVEHGGSLIRHFHAYEEEEKNNVIEA